MCFAAGLWCLPNLRSHVSRENDYRRKVVKSSVTLGANATVVSGHAISVVFFIGAGTLVTHDVPAYALMVVIPAKRIGWMCLCGKCLL